MPEDEWRPSSYNIVENGQNNEKSPGDLSRLAFNQTPMKDHQLRLMWKTLKEQIIMIIIIIIIIIIRRRRRRRRRIIIRRRRRRRRRKGANAVNWHKKGTWRDTTDWKSWLTGNCARNWNLTILPNDICTPRIHAEQWDKRNFLRIVDINRSLNSG